MIHIRHNRFTAKQLWLIAAAVLLLVVITRVVTQSVYAASSDSRTGRHVLTIYDSGTEKGVLTEADTLRDALKEADIELAANDITEPSLDSELVASSYDVNIYRARPVVVVDGNTTSKVMTPYQTPKQIAKQANIELRDEDQVDMEHRGDLLLAGSLEQMVIDRAEKVNFVFYGKDLVVYTHASTVGDMLREREVELASNDTLSVDPDTPIKNGMTIELWRNGVQTITKQEKINFSVQKIVDKDRPAGYKKIQTPGVKGERTVTYKIEMKNGKEVDRTKIKSVTVKEPTKQVEIVGADPADMPYTGGGNKSDWLSASNIPESQWGYADWLVQKESGWNPNARNVSSGACGLGQQLPCGKWAGQWNNPVDSLNGMHGYVMGRYGSWEAAVAHSRTVGWY